MIPGKIFASCAEFQGIVSVNDFGLPLGFQELLQASLGFLWTFGFARIRLYPQSRQWTKRHSQFGTFSQTFFNRTFSNCLSHNSPAKGWPCRFRSRRTTGLSKLDHDLGLLCFGRRIKISGHFDFGIFNNAGASSILTWVQEDTASAACARQPGSLDVISITFAVVICDADDPCSVNAAHEPESSFTMSPRSTTRPLYFWNWGSTSEFLRWQISMNDAK